ncbi:hypothetical protein WMW72_18195 [Paenibacillus filicis]|uniref:LysM domain-containing protein n=1 Tax=Paenibacillus filicis TaxID=669464 RepID=A0ABU9DQ01_9BACL
MKKHTHASKVVISTLALTLLLGGGAFYGLNAPANAEDSAAVAPSTGSGSSSEQDGSAKSAPKSWFGKHSSKDQAGKEGPAGKGKHGEGQQPHQAGKAIIEEAAGILGISQDKLTASLQKQTLAEVAKEHGVSEADLVTKLKALRIARIDEAVASGKLTADQASRMKDNLDKHLTFLVQHNLKKLHKPHGRGVSHILPAPDKLAALLGITESELKAELKAGKSLTEIAAAQGIDKEQLVAKIKENLTPWVEKAVDRKHVKDSKPDQP